MYREIQLFEEDGEHVAVDETIRATGDSAAEALINFARKMD